MNYFLTAFSLTLVLLFSGMKSSTAQELLIPNEELQIGGTLELPENHQKGEPLVILITGSGAQDRDETIYGFKPFKVIAEHLADQGIASFRYDDRQIGESTGDFAASTLDDLTNDVIAIMDYFQYQSEVLFDDFILLGHSQGGIVSAKVAATDDRVTKLILMASTMVPLKDVINEQVTIMQKAAGKSEEDIEYILGFQELAYEATRTNEGWDELKVEFQKLVEREIAKLPEAQRQYIVDVEAFANTQFNAQVTPLRSPQMRSLLFYDPAEDLSKLRIPMFAIFGGKDTQVTVEQNYEKFDELCAANDLDCTSQIHNNANHLFQPANTGFVTEYATLPKEFLEGFLTDISEWIVTGF
jgi:pimeloyl-ACP methyl ester carboxylesterase